MKATTTTVESSAHRSVKAATHRSMKAATHRSMKAATEARAAARRVPLSHAAVVKTAESSGMRARLTCKGMLGPFLSMFEVVVLINIVAVIKIVDVAIKVGGVARDIVVIDDSGVVRYVGVVVVDYAMVMPVGSPVAPSPAETAEVADP